MLKLCVPQRATLAAGRLPPTTLHHLLRCCLSAEASSADSETSTEPVDLRTCSHQQLRRIGKTDIRSKLTEAHLCLLGTGSNELSPSFLLNCTSRTYLFNHSEGLKRMIEMHGRTLKDCVSLFTRASWENVGGSFGAYQAILDRCKHGELDDAELNMRVMLPYCGPSDLPQYVEYISMYTGLRTWQNMIKMEPGLPGFVRDENMAISMVDFGSVAAYSCKMTDWAGTFLPERALELGISPGPAYKVLTSGRSVITERGELVHSDQVMTGARKGPTFLVVECPTEQVASSVTNNQYLQAEWYRERGEMVSLVVHITPLQILQDDGYCQWMASFGKDTKHLFLHSSLCPGEVSYRSAMAFSLPLHLMNPSVYRLPQLPQENVVDKSSLNICKYLSEDSIVFGRALMKYHLKPSLRLDESSCLDPIRGEVERTLSTIEHDSRLSKGISNHRKMLTLNPTWTRESVMASLTEDSPSLAPSDPTDVRVTFLGTSSATATKLRNMSGILVQTATSGSMLLDCGEGTLCQMYRRFGRKGCEEVLRDLRLIFVSHLHPDHISGVMRVLTEVGRLTNHERGGRGGDGGSQMAVKILSSTLYGRNLSKCGRQMLEGCEYEFVNVQDALRRPLVLGGSGGCGGTVSVQPVPVRHIKHSYGAVLKFPGDRSLVYSGDTMPCKELVRAGQDATLLIHEATLDNDMVAEARGKLHSTFNEAVKVGAEMNSGFTLATHFSTRYVMLPLLYPWPWGVAPALDLMTLDLSDLQRQGLDSVSRELYFMVKDWAYVNVEGLGYHIQDQQ